MFSRFFYEKNFATFCLTSIAIAAIIKLTDPIAIVTGVVGAIAGFITAKYLGDKDNVT